MADLETRVDKLEGRVTNIEMQVTQLSTKIDMFIGEMRDRDNQRAEEIRELRQDMKEMQKRSDEKFAAIETKMDSISNHIHNFAIATVIGIAAIVIAAFMK